MTVFVTEWGTCTYTGDGTISTSGNTSWQNWLDQYELSAANWFVGRVEESCSAFSTTSQGYGALAGMDGVYYTQSGYMMKGYLANNPTSYSKCGSYVKPSSSSSATPASSASTGARSASSKTHWTEDYWGETNDWDDGGLSTVTYTLSSTTGLSGTVKLGSVRPYSTAYYSPFAGFQYYPNGVDEPSVDASSWDGVCITYTATSGLRLYMLTEDDKYYT